MKVIFVTMELISKKQLLGISLSSALLTAIAGGILHASGTPWHVASLGLVLAFAIVVAGFLLTGVISSSAERAALKPKNQHHAPWRIAAGTWVWAFTAYLVYALGVSAADVGEAVITVNGSLIYLGMISIPFVFAVLASLMPVGGRPWWLLAIILIIWAPFDSGLLAPVWPWPEGGAAYMLNVWISCVLAMAAMKVAGAESCIGVVNFRIMPKKADLDATLRDQLWFTPLAIGFGFLTGFFAWNPKIAPFWQYPVEALGLYLTVALPEELLFRGLMQPTLEAMPWPKTWNKKLTATWMTALIFGLSHLNNEPLWDWRYVALATVAGLAYANVYERTGRKSLAAPALLHTGVDWLWSNFLRSF